MFNDDDDGSLPEGRFVGCYANKMNEVVSRCLPHRQLWVSNLSKVATQWLEVDSNLWPTGCKAQNILTHHRVPYSIHEFKQVILISTESRDYCNESVISKP